MRFLRTPVLNSTAGRLLLQIEATEEFHKNFNHDVSSLSTIHRASILRWHIYQVHIAKYIYSHKTWFKKIFLNFFFSMGCFCTILFFRLNFLKIC